VKGSLQQLQAHLSLGLLSTGLLRLVLLIGNLARCPSALLIGAGRGDNGRVRDGGSGGVSLALATTGTLLRSARSVAWDRSLSNLLELLGDGVVVVGCTGVLELGHWDAEVLSVLESLIVAHVLGKRVASLVGVNPGVVKTQVVLVGIIPALVSEVS
jgi:hypothetical protein